MRAGFPIWVAVGLMVLTAAVGCRGGGSAEEALEAYNGAMAAKDFAGAAHMVFCETWEGYDAGELARARAEYAEELAKSYELSDLDYGRGVIGDRDKPAPGVVRLYVAYERRSAPAAPAVTYVMPFKRVGGMWYYYLPSPPGR